MPRFEVEYVDAQRGESVRKVEVEAEDEGEALDKAYQEDYYFGRLLSIEEVEG